MNLFERILYLAEKLESNSQTQFAKKIGVPQPTLYGYLNVAGEVKIRHTLLLKILDVYPNVSRDWLFFGEGNPFIEKSIAVPRIAIDTAQKISPIPLIGFASCSTFGWYGTMTIPVSVELPAWHEGMVAVMASGESMLPAGIGHGQVCYCDTTKEPGKGEAVYVEQEDGCGTIKMYLGRGVIGAGTPCLNLQGWLDREKPDTPQNPFLLDVATAAVRTLAPVIYVRRRL